MNPLNTVAGTITAGIVLAVIIAVATTGVVFNAVSFIVWIHVLAGITWIGLLYYFNFVQVPALADAMADEGGPGGAGITKYVAPRALWWFRWGALVTWLTGAAALGHYKIFADAFALGMLGDTFNMFVLKTKLLADLLFKKATESFRDWSDKADITALHRFCGSQMKHQFNRNGRLIVNLKHQKQRLLQD